MSVNTKKYTKKNARTAVDRGEFRAIRVTERNYVNVANWAKGIAIETVSATGDVSRQRVKVGKLIAQVGDFVVRKVGESTAFRVKDDVFEAEFQLAK